MIEEEYQKKLALEAETEIFQLNNTLKNIKKNI